LPRQPLILPVIGASLPIHFRHGRRRQRFSPFQHAPAAFRHAALFSDVFSAIMIAAFAAIAAFRLSPMPPASFCHYFLRCRRHKHLLTDGIFFAPSPPASPPRRRRRFAASHFALDFFL